MKLLTAKDIQRILSCSKNRSYELLHSSGFPTLQICGRYYVKEDALNQWIDTYTGRKYTVWKWYIFGTFLRE